MVGQRSPRTRGFDLSLWVRIPAFAGMTKGCGNDAVLQEPRAIACVASDCGRGDGQCEPKIARRAIGDDPYQGQAWLPRHLTNRQGNRGISTNRLRWFLTHVSVCCDSPPTGMTMMPSVVN
jgi:hypothetical protein